MASNNSALIRPGGHFRVFMDTVTVTDGTMHGEVLVREGDLCKRDFITALRAHRKDQFTIMFWGHNDVGLVRPNHYPGVTSPLAYLLVRDPITRPEILQEFRSVCTNRGLHEEQIVVPGPQDRCEMFRD